MKQMIRMVALVLMAFLGSALLSAQEGARYALVIGNGEYTDIGTLKNPVNDANDIASALKQLGYQVSILTNANRKQMNQGLNDFHDKLAQDPSGAGFFWYAGHGVQSKGENYLIPVGADIKREVDLEDEAVSVRKLTLLLDDARNRINVIVLDACRNNPLPGLGRSGTRGLTVVSAAPAESLIMYSTGVGQTAADGAGRNSPFAQAFLKYLSQPGDITATIKSITAETKRLTKGEQVPYLYSSLTLDFNLNPAGTPERKPSLAVEKTYGSVAVEVKTKGTLYLNGTAMGLLTPGVTARLNDIETGQASLEMRYGDGKAETRTVEVPKDVVTAVSFTYVEQPKTPENAGSNRSAISLQNAEDTSFYYVLDPPALAGLDQSSAALREKVAAYFSTESKDFPFRSLQPNSGTRIEGLPNGAHLLVGFFAAEDRSSFPVRVLALTVDSNVGERSYNIFSDPAYMTVQRGKGRLSRFAERPKVPENMVLVQGGTFTMGSPLSEAGRSSSEVQHQVNVGGFSMAKYETTVADFRAFAQATGYKTSAEIRGKAWVLEPDGWTEKAGASWRNPGFAQGDNEPIVCVSWYDAVAYCNWRSAQEGKKPAYSWTGKGTESRNWPSGWNNAEINNYIQCDWTPEGYRLPTEAEWEYAARASGSGSQTFAWAGSSSVGDVGWYSDNSGGRPHPVGQKKTNGIGLYDMSGNVWEWCWDWYGDYVTGTPVAPTGPSSGTYRTERGGSWYSVASSLRVAYRRSGNPWYASTDFGFRVCIPSAR